MTALCGAASRLALSLSITIGGIVAACHNDVPGPTTPTPLTPEVTRQAPRPQKIDPSKHKPRKVRVSERAHVPVDAGVSDVIDLPPNPDASVAVVRDAGQPLK